MPTDLQNMVALAHLINLADSALPVGGFSFSCGVESAIEQGVVVDRESLDNFVRSRLWQSGTLDGVAALTAHRAITADNWHAAAEADRRLERMKAGEENRNMSLRMGRKLAELAARMIPLEPQLGRWVAAIETGAVAGCHATTQGVLFAVAGLDEQCLFTASLCGVANQMLSASLRLMRLTHYDTQALLYGLAPWIEEIYAQVCPMRLEQMHLFAPESEILASLHERGAQRLFMN